MRKIKRVLDLNAHGLSQRAIAGATGISQSTVSEYLAAASAAGVTGTEARAWDEAEVERRLFPPQPAPEFWRKHAAPDWGQIQRDLQQHPDLTLQLVWDEYRAAQANGYTHSGIAPAGMTPAWLQWNGS